MWQDICDYCSRERVHSSSLPSAVSSTDHHPLKIVKATHSGIRVLYLYLMDIREIAAMNYSRQMIKDRRKTQIFKYREKCKGTVITSGRERTICMYIFPFQNCCICTFFFIIKWYILHSILGWELLFSQWKVRFREIRDLSQKNIN